MTARPRSPGAAALTRVSRAWTCRGRLRSPGRGSFSTGGAGRGWRGTGQAPAPGSARGGGWARGAGLSHVPAPGNRSGVLSRAAPAPRPHPGTPPLGIRARATEEVGDPSPTTEPQPPAVPLQVARPQLLQGRVGGTARGAGPLRALLYSGLRPPAFPSSPGLGGVGGAEAPGSPAPPAAHPAEACARPAVT